MMGFGFGFGGILMGIMMVIVWVAVISIAVWLLSLLFPRATHSASSSGTLKRSDTLESPIDILKQRYARGEITKEQFDQMRHDLEA